MKLLAWPSTAFLVVVACSAFTHGFYSDGLSAGCRTFARSAGSSRSILQEANSTLAPPTSRALTDYQERGARIVASFSPDQFEPLPWMSGKHVQTIASAFVRNVPACAYVSPDNVFPAAQAIGSYLWQRIVSLEDNNSVRFWDERERIETPDLDWFHVDYKYANGEAVGLVIILHGLHANSQAPLCTDMGRAYHNLGMDVACINFRGCSGTPNDTLGGYHLGFTDDLIHFLSTLKSRYKSSELPPIYVSGYSLGGNVVLKALGELREEAVQQYNIQGAAVLCTPMDCERNMPFLGAEGFNQLVYCRNLLIPFWKRSQQQLETFCDGNVDTDLFDYHGVMSAKTVSDFDAAYVAPIYGFENEIDYYRKTSSVYFLEGISVPTLILNARDDPFMDPTYFPVEKSSENGGNAPLKMVLTEHGGHLGFTFHQTAREHLDDAQDGPSWVAAELARFLQHVHTHPLSTGTK